MLISSVWGSGRSKVTWKRFLAKQHANVNRHLDISKVKGVQSFLFPICCSPMLLRVKCVGLKKQMKCPAKFAVIFISHSIYTN